MIKYDTAWGCIEGFIKYTRWALKLTCTSYFQSLPDLSEKEQDNKTPSWICGCLVLLTAHAPQIKCKVIKKIGNFTLFNSKKYIKETLISS